MQLFCAHAAFPQAIAHKTQKLKKFLYPLQSAIQFKNECSLNVLKPYDLNKYNSNLDHEECYNVKSFQNVIKFCKTTFTNKLFF